MQILPSALRHIFRSLFARPAYLVVSVVVLGASIAAQLAIVAVISALLLEPPTARQPEQLAFVESSLPRGIVSYPDFRDLQERTTTFAGMFGYYITRAQTRTMDDEIIAETCGAVSGSYFPVLGAGAGDGRLFEATDDVANAAPVAVISSELSLQRQLRPGATIRINTFPFTVVGVLPPDYRGIERTVRVDVLIPMAQIAAIGPRGVLTSRGSQWVSVGGRLKPGVTLAAANAELAAVARTIQAENAGKNYGMTFRLRSFAGWRYARDSSARIMVLLGGLVWFLIALAFTNFFALTLLRLLERQRELAVKVALGATRSHLGWALLGELGCVAGAALAAGGGLAWALLRIMQRDARLGSLIASAGVQLDWTALGVVAGSVLAGALVVWLLALRAAGRVDVLSAMKEGASAPRRQAAFAALFALQLAIALFLGATAVSFVDALQTLAGRSYPFRTEKLLLFDVNFRNLGVTNDSVSLAEKFLARIRTVPGVVAAGGGPAPLAGVGWSNVIVDGRDPALEPDKGFANMANATGDYFPAAGIRVRQGRAVTSQEVLNKAKAIVINTALAKRYWPGKDPIGRAMKPWDGGADYTVVGVVDDVPADTSGKTPPQFYLPWGAASGANLTFHVAVQSDSAEMRKAIVASLSDVWPAKTPPPLRSIRDQIGEVSTELQTAVRVVFWLAGFATLVTSCGLYFFSSYTAAQTLRDSAIRQALGARWTHLVGSHLARYRVGLGCGLGLGVGLLIGARPLFAYLGIASIPMTASYIVLAAVLLLVLALIGLCVPLRKVLRLNLARILGQGT